MLSLRQWVLLSCGLVLNLSMMLLYTCRVRLKLTLRPVRPPVSPVGLHLNLMLHSSSNIHYISNEHYRNIRGAYEASTSVDIAPLGSELGTGVDVVEGC